MQEIDSVLTVNAVKNVPFSYPFCVICLRKITLRTNQRWNCAHCGNWQNESKVQHRYRLVFNVTDCHTLADVTVFGKSLEKMFGETADQFNKYLADLESVLFEKELAVAQVLLHAVQQVFCGSSFCFTFTVPLNQSKNQTNVSLKSLEARITGGLVAKRISFVTNGGQDYLTVKEAVQYFSAKLTSKAKVTDFETYLSESSYFSNNSKGASAEKVVCKKHLHSSTFCESVEFCSPGDTKLEISLSESEISGAQGLERMKILPTSFFEKCSLEDESKQLGDRLQGSLCSPWMDKSSILISSTPLPIIGSTKNVIAGSLNSIPRDSKYFQNYNDDFFNTNFGKCNAQVGKFNEGGARRHKKCFKALLPFYQPYEGTIQSCLMDSEWPNEIDGRSSKKDSIILNRVLTPVHFEKSIECMGDSLLGGQMHSSLMADSAMSPDMFR